MRARELLAELAEKADLPADIAAGLPTMELCGFREFSLEPHDGLVEYSRERISMESVLKELDPGIFVPVERGYVVNMKRIRRISGDTLYLEKGYEVQVSRARLPKVKQEISRCWGGRRS